MIANALSVDVEEYYHAGIFRRAVPGFTAREFESRVEQSLDDLLELLRGCHVRGTFFVLGEIAALHPVSVRRIAAEGHEIACHGDCHEDVYRQSPHEFREDLRKAKHRIEDAVGAAVVGYRAPNFSIGRAQCWAYQILLEEGFRYDSSTYPIVHDRYGYSRAPRFPFEIWRDGSEGLMEFPIGTVRVLGRNMPIGGGGYFRLVPYSVTRLGIQHVNAIEHRPVMFYIHPWEIDPDQPRPSMSLRATFRHYVGVRKQAAKLRRLFEQFHFAPARDVLHAWAPAAALVQASSPQVTRYSRSRAVTDASGSVTRMVPDAANDAIDAGRELPNRHLAHSMKWAAVIKQAYGHDPLYLAAEDEAGNRGVLPAFVVRRPLTGAVVSSMPFLDGGGPCATSPALETKLIVRLLQEARRIGARVVEIRASRRLPIAAAPQEHKVNMVLPLTGSLDDVFSRIDRAARSQIRKAARSSLSIEIGGSEHIDTFYALFVERMRELGSPVHSKAFFDAIMEHFGDQARLIIARSGSQPVGGLFALASDDVLTVPWAASLRSHASLNTNMLLYWETIQAAHGLGFERFDFGRSTRDSGTYRFKRQWGAREEPLYWYSLPNAVNDVTHAAAEHDDSMSASAADFCVHMWQHLPLGLTRHLGPRVRKYLTQ